MGGRARRAAGLLWADYRALYVRKRPGRREPAAKAAVMMVPRTVVDANLQALALVRAVGGAPPVLRGLLQRGLLWGHGMHVDPGAEIGPGLFLPHPVAIAVGPGVRVGADVALFHDVTLCAAPSGGAAPRVGDGAALYVGATVVGDVAVGAGATIGAGTVVTADVPAGERRVRRHGRRDGDDPALGGSRATECGAMTTAERMPLGALLRADHAARFGAGPAPTRGGLLRAAARDRSFRVVAVVRLMQAGPAPPARVGRRILLAHGCDIGHDAVIGPGLALPFASGVVIGRRAILGAGVVLHEHTTATPTRMSWREADAGPGFRLGDGARLLPGAGAFGDDVTIAPGAVLAPHAIATRDVAAVRGVRPRDGRAQAAVADVPARMSLLALIRSDLERAAAGGGSRGRAALGVPFQAAVMVRLATSRRRRLARLGRAAAGALHHCAVDRDVRLGPGLLLPLPCGIRLEAGVRIGAGATLYDRVSLRSDRCLEGDGAAPWIGDGAVVGSGAVAIGAVAVEGALDPGAVVLPAAAAAFSSASPLGHRHAGAPD